MTVVNPKKLRPYDEPPRRRRRLIPDSPGSAAIGFLVAAAVWVAAATGLGALAVGMRTLPGLEMELPLGFFDLSFTFESGRVRDAFFNATVYGWLSNAGFAALCFILPRLVGRPLASEKAANAALGIWNLSVAGGIGALYIFDPGPNVSLTAFPWLIDGGMAFALLILTATVVLTVGPAIRGAYVSAWFGIVALLSLLALTGANALLGFVELFVDLPDLTTALGSILIGRAVETLWLLGMTYAALHYVVPRATGNPIHSNGVALLAWILWLVLAPVSALAGLRDPSVPFFIASAGSVATILLLVPAFLVALNLLLTMRGAWALSFRTGTVALALVGIAFLVGASLLAAIGALHSVALRVVNTDWTIGAFVFAALGAYTFSMLALANHAQPRLLRRAWDGGPLAGLQLWTGFAGATIAGLALMGAGLAERSLRDAAAAPEAIDAATLPYLAGASAGMALVALSGLLALISLFLLYTSAEPIDYELAPAAPQQAAPPAAQTSAAAQ